MEKARPEVAALSAAAVEAEVERVTAAAAPRQSLQTRTCRAAGTSRAAGSPLEVEAIEPRQIHSARPWWIHTDRCCSCQSGGCCLLFGQLPGQDFEYPNWGEVAAAVELDDRLSVHFVARSFIARGGSRSVPVILCCVPLLHRRSDSSRASNDRRCTRVCCLV